MKLGYMLAERLPLVKKRIIFTEVVGGFFRG